jgi:hypothetical protein
MASDLNSVLTSFYDDVLTHKRLLMRPVSLILLATQFAVTFSKIFCFLLAVGKGGKILSTQSVKGN